MRIWEDRLHDLPLIIYFTFFFYKWSNKYHDTHFLHQIFMRQHELFGGLKAKKKCIFLPSCQHFMSMACIQVKNTYRCGQWCCRCDGPKMGTEWRTHLKIKEVFCYRIWENKTNIHWNKVEQNTDGQRQIDKGTFHLLSLVVVVVLITIIKLVGLMVFRVCTYAEIMMYK